MTPATERLLAHLAGSGCETLTARQALTQFGLGFNQASDLLDELAAQGVLLAPAGDRSLNRVYHVVPGAAARLLGGAVSLCPRLGPRSRLSGLAQRRAA